MLRIRTLGGLSVQRQDRSLAGAATQPRRLAVLALIARSGPRGVTRDKLLSLLWADSEPDAARRALTQALYALRKDLGADELFVGVQELRLDPELARCDVVAFDAALAAGELEAAAAEYGGPFLDGFRLPGAAEFERWVDDERTDLQHRYAVLLERLARRAAQAGDRRAAVQWWRRLAGLDPLNAAVAVSLMEALHTAGDRAGALQHARIYEALVDQELDLPPDGEVIALAARIRAEPAPARSPAPPESASPVVTGAAETPAPIGSSAPVPPAATPSSVPLPLPTQDAPGPTVPGAAAAPAAAASARGAARPGGTLRGTRTGRVRRALLAWRWASSALLVLVVALASLTVRWSAHPAEGTEAVLPILAVGAIADYTDEGVGAAALADMLATNLARAPGVQVISTPRLYALLEAPGRRPDVGAAARQAGAAMLLEGSIYRTAAGGLRLDLRRIELSSGAVAGAYTVEGDDLFQLADASTAQLVAELGGRLPAGPLAESSTGSITAYRLYEQGLRAFARGDVGGSAPLFAAALEEDSSFAMAAYYAALSAGGPRSVRLAALHSALRLADGAGDRERLIIRSGWALLTSAPELHALADSLITRFPHELDGHVLLGHALLQQGDFSGAVPHLRHAVAMDSTAMAAGALPCAGCDAMQQLISAYLLADSVGAAVREAEQWTRLQPRSPRAWWELAGILSTAGRSGAAEAALQQALSLEPNRPYAFSILVANHLRDGEFDAADALLQSQLAAGAPESRDYARWLLVVSLRYQGRYAEALDQARRLRAEPGAAPTAGDIPAGAIAEAQVLWESGRTRAAAALFDSIANWPPVPGEAPSHRGRQRAWHSTHAADARAAAGDTVGLAALADSVRRWGLESAYARDRQLHHHLRGVLLSRQGRDVEAIEEFRRSVFSPTAGYTRSQLELARLLMRQGRPAEAVATLQPTLRGPLEASNLYVTRTELHEALGLAWEAAGRADSAAYHLDRAASAWRRADPPLASRRAAAERRLAALRP